MKHLALTWLLLVTAAGHAQGATQVVTDPAHLTEWLTRATTLELAIPGGASMVALHYGSEATFPGGMATFLRVPVRSETNRLRLTVLPPEEPGSGDLCGRAQGLATLFVSQALGAEDGPLHHLPFCVPYPDTPELAGSFQHVVQAAPAALGAWTPVYLHAWLLGRETQAEAQTLLMDQAFTVQVAFLSGDRTGFPEAAPVTIRQILTSRPLSVLVERYELIGPP